VLFAKKKSIYNGGIVSVRHSVRVFVLKTAECISMKFDLGGFILKIVG